LKYLGVPLGLKRRSKIKYAEEKRAKIFEYIEKVENSGLAPNHKIYAVITVILPKMNYISANSFIQQKKLDPIDKKVRNMVYKITRGQRLPNNFIHASYQGLRLGISSMKDYYNTYKIHHTTHLMKTECGRMILRGDLSLNGVLSKFHLVNLAIDNSLTKVGLKWYDWEKFKNIEDNIDESINDTDEMRKTNHKFWRYKYRSGISRQS
jgi:hypothetical protein